MLWVWVLRGCNKWDYEFNAWKYRLRGDTWNRWSWCSFFIRSIIPFSKSVLKNLEFTKKWSLNLVLGSASISLSPTLAPCFSIVNRLSELFACKHIKSNSEQHGRMHQLIDINPFPTHDWNDWPYLASQQNVKRINTWHIKWLHKVH